MYDIAIIGGTGKQGYGLAFRWALAGKRIVIGSRDKSKADESAHKLEELFRKQDRQIPDIIGLANAEAAAAAPVIVVSVPLAAQIATMKAIRDHIQPRSLLIDVTVPLATAIGGRVSRMLGLPAGSAAEQLAEHAPEHVQVMSAFHFLSAELLADEDAAPVDCDVIACGGDEQAQTIVRELTACISGTRYVHAGVLSTSRLVEATATLLIALNIRKSARHAGMRVTGLVE